MPTSQHFKSPSPINTGYSQSHSYIETLEQIPSHPIHILRGALLQDTYTWYTDDSSFVHKRAWKAGYVIVLYTKVVEAQALLVQTTNQQSELMALTHAFQLEKGQSLNLYIDSKYTLYILLLHAMIWRKHGLYWSHLSVPMVTLSLLSDFTLHTSVTK